MHRLWIVVGTLGLFFAAAASLTFAAATPNATLSYHLDSSWDTGFQSSFRIQNHATTALSAWTLEFDLPHPITSIWDAQIASHTSTHYVIKGAAWNVNIPANGEVNFGFVAQTVGKLGAPTNCKLNGTAIACNSTIGAASATPTKTKKTQVSATPRKTKRKPKTPTPVSTKTKTPVKSSTPTPTKTKTAVPTVGPSPTNIAQPAFPARLFAPYVDLLLWPTPNLAQMASASGSKYFTLAFIVDGGSCSASWGGVIPLNQNFGADLLSQLRAAGGNAIVSFGGENGVELAQSCTSVSALQAQYQAVIDQYQFTQIDFDIEGGTVADPTSIDRRNQAIAGLQAAAQARGKSLTVSYTLPVMPYGLTADGVSLLQNAIQRGVNVSVVNAMAMDYGDPSLADPHKMGTNAINAATSVQGQLKTLYPSKTDAALWHMVGVTPMIGLNDTSPEVFSLTDAQQVLTFAWQNNLARIAMWSAGRDQSCPNNGAYTADDCSGIVQQPWDFSKTWKAFNQ